MEHKVWIEVSLPISFGGLGTRQLKDIAQPAFLSSAYGTLNIVSQILNHSDECLISDIQEALESWNVVNNNFPTVRYRQIFKRIGIGLMCYELSRKN